MKIFCDFEISPFLFYIIRGDKVYKIYFFNFFMAKKLENGVKLEEMEMELNGATLSLVEKYYPILKRKGLVENRTQTLTYLSYIGGEVLDYIRNGEVILSGKKVGDTKYDTESVKELKLKGF